MEPLTLTALATTVYNIVKPIITSKPAKDIIEAAKGSGNELWEKIKPWFIEEEKETEELKDLQENPDDKDYEDAFVTKLKMRLKKDENLRKGIEDFLAEKEKEGDKAVSIAITNSKNVNTGNFTGNRDVHFGDNINTKPM